jgi:hypothetical protein
MIISATLCPENQALRFSTTNREGVVVAHQCLLVIQVIAGQRGRDTPTMPNENVLSLSRRRATNSVRFPAAQTRTAHSGGGAGSHVSRHGGCNTLHPLSQNHSICNGFGVDENAIHVFYTILQNYWLDLAKRTLLPQMGGISDRRQSPLLAEPTGGTIYATAWISRYFLHNRPKRGRKSGKSPLLFFHLASFLRFMAAKVSKACIRSFANPR